MKSEPFGRRVDVAETPGLQLPEPRHLEEVRPLLRDEFDANAERVHVPLPKLVVLAIDDRRRRRHLDRQRTAVG